LFTEQFVQSANQWNN